MVDDPIGDMCTQIRNAQLAKKDSISIPFSKEKMSLGKILVEEGYLASLDITEKGTKKYLKIILKYNGNEPAITGIKRLSKPGLRYYVGHQNIPQIVGGLGMTVISTSSGVMTGKSARKQNIGGELLCAIW